MDGYFEFIPEGEQPRRVSEAFVINALSHRRGCVGEVVDVMKVNAGAKLATTTGSVRWVNNQ